MKTRYKFIHFEQETNGKWICRNNKMDGVLGYVIWYPSWGQWAFVARDDLRVFSADCLQDIIHFIGQLSKGG